MRSISLFLLTLPLALASCVHHAAEAGGNADSSIAAVRAQIQELDTALIQVRTELHAGRDVNQNDKWTLRLLGLGVLMLGLSYPVGKIVWIASTRVARREGKSSPPAPRDYCAFRNRIDERTETIVPA